MEFKGKFLLPVLLIIASCGGNVEEKKKETTQTGKTLIAVDESFQPIVDEEKAVFEHLNEQAEIDVIYGPENRIVSLLLNDSVRFAVLSRELTEGEKKILVGRSLPPETNRFAIDAITLIVNSTSADTLITVGELKKALNGQAKKDVSIVFDNPNSGLVRYLKALSGANELQGRNIYALKDSKEVIKYVSEHRNAIGLTGFAWLNDADSDYSDAVKKVKIVAVKDDNKQTGYFKPSQTTLALKQYPLTRDLFIVNSTGRMGLGAGFAYFMLSDRGQRIILRSGILPDSIPNREINIKREY